MTTDMLTSTLAHELGIRTAQVEQTIALLDAGNTIPFIARYRKEVTGSLDEEQLRQLAERLTYLRSLAERKAAVLASIQEQGKLTPELQAAIEAATTLQAVEDLYQPYRPKRRTRGMIARERGLEPLAQLILAQPLTRESLDQLAAPYLSDDVPTPEDAWAGARDIVAETISDDAEVRQAARQLAMERGYLGSELTEAEQDPRHVYELYYQFVEAVPRLRPHQILALNRGESEGALKLKLDPPSDMCLDRIARKFRPNPRSALVEQLNLATRDSWERLLAPAIERDVRRALTETAQEQAIKVFATNLKALLLQPPIRGHAVIGIDPGIRTGCKVAAVDATGKVLGHAHDLPARAAKAVGRKQTDLEQDCRGHRRGLDRHRQWHGQPRDRATRGRGDPGGRESQIPDRQRSRRVGVFRLTLGARRVARPGCVAARGRVHRAACARPAGGTRQD